MTNSISAGMAVVVLPDGDLLRKWARTDVVACGPFALKGEPHVRLASDYRHVPVAHVRPHWLAAEIAKLNKASVDELDFPYPPCSRCHVETWHDGDGFRCHYCLATWGERGGGVARCVEKEDHEADVTGADGQPRCAMCETRVRTGEIEEPSGPYKCRGCRTEVVGIGLLFDNDAARNRRCGECQRSAEQSAWLDEIIQRRRESTKDGAP